MKMCSSENELVFINIQGFYLVEHCQPVAVAKYVVGIRYPAWTDASEVLPLVEVAEYEEPEIEVFKLEEILSIVALHASPQHKTLETVQEALALHKPPTLVSYSNYVNQ